MCVTSPFLKSNAPSSNVRHLEMGTQLICVGSRSITTKGGRLSYKQSRCQVDSD